MRQYENTSRPCPGEYFGMVWVGALAVFRVVRTGQMTHAAVVALAAPSSAC